MDLAAAARAGVVFFTHKLTEGRSNQHIHAGEVLGRAKAAGIPFLGGYHVVHTTDVPGQVDYLIAYADRVVPWWRTFGGWFWQADAENWGSDFPSAAVVKAFCDLLASRTGKRVICYASHGQYGNTLGGLGHPLWNANYPNSHAGTMAQLYPGDGWSGWTPYSGQTPVIVQYSDNATIGRQPGCDANAFRGSLDQLRAMLAPGSARPNTTSTEDRMFLKSLPTGDGAQTILLFPYDGAANPYISIGCDTGADGASRAAFRIAAHVAGTGPGSGWVILRDISPAFTVGSQDQARQDLPLPKGTDRASIRRIPADPTDKCTVPCSVLAWW